MDRKRVARLITAIGLIISIPATILAYQQIDRPWPSKSRVVELEAQVAGLRYESLMASYLRCKQSLKRNPNDHWLKVQCEKLKRSLQKGK